jgi:hypothetical protein
MLGSPFTTRDLSQEQLAECRSLNGPVRSGKSDIDIHPVCFRLISMRCFRRFPSFETEPKYNPRLRAGSRVTISTACVDE